MPEFDAPPAHLIRISGHDSPGIAAAATAILAAHCATILDIGQAVVHESLALGILIAGLESAAVADLESALHDRLSILGLRTNISPVDAHDLTHWNRAQDKSHFIVTLLGRQITSTMFAETTAVVTACGFNIARIERLTSQLGGSENERTNACIELAICGDFSYELSLRTQLLAVAQKFSIDIACQREGIYRLNRRLIAFDMDSTLIQGEVIDELARMAGVGEQVSRITEAAMRGELDFDQSFTRRVALLKGLPAERVYSLLGTIPLAEGAERMFAALRLLGLKTAILSGGFTFFARSLQERFSIDHVHANQLEIADGAVTGRVIPPIMNGARKAELLREIAAAEGIPLGQVVAVGDGANDIPMLSLAGMGIAYRAKPIVRQQADQSISSLGLDGLLYLLGMRDRDLLGHDSE